MIGSVIHVSALCAQALITCSNAVLNLILKIPFATVFLSDLEKSKS